MCHWDRMWQLGWAILVTSASCSLDGGSVVALDRCYAWSWLVCDIADSQHIQGRLWTACLWECGFLSSDVLREIHGYRAAMGIHCILDFICGLLYFHFLNVILSLVFLFTPKKVCKWLVTSICCNLTCSFMMTFFRMVTAWWLLSN